MWIRSLIVLVVLCTSLPVASAGYDGSATPRLDWPVPPVSRNLLFYVQRSSNPNTIVYAANIASDGRLDPENPVDVYWLRFNTDGARKDLSVIERSMAFGVSARPAPDTSGEFIVSVNGMPEREARIYVRSDGQAAAEMVLNGTKARLVSAWVALDGTGFIPPILYVDIVGEAVANGRRIVERIDPR